MSEMDICNYINMVKFRVEVVYYYFLKILVMIVLVINFVYFWNFIYIIYCVE